MQRLFGLLALCLVLLTPGAAPAQGGGERRIALIIANEAYVSPNLGRLPGTQRDAALMESALRAVGFEVTVARNVERAQMRDAILSFARRLGQLGQNGVGFFYYSGHGIADDPRGRNYLVPIDAQVSAVTDLPIVALSLNDELDAIELAHARATVIVIDACRNTPISFGRGGRGLAPVSALTDTLIAFSTQPGETAADDGVYARVLSEELVRPGVRISQAFDVVQMRVAEATQRRQRPRYDNGLVSPIMFVPGAAAPAIPATIPPLVAQRPPPNVVAEPLPDARTVQPQTAVPVLSSVAQLRDFALFRDCEGCPEMVVIPAGSFVMGSPASESGRYTNEGPQRRVAIQQFAVGRTEVTFDQWAACVSGGGCTGNPAPSDNGWGRGSRPVINMSWDDAQDYVRWLSMRASRSAVLVSSGDVIAYRLLSEAEWEYAARAGTTTRFSWGDQDPVCDPGARNGASFSGCTIAGTRPVGSFAFAANAFGLFDMHGNAVEWVEDCYENTLDAIPSDGRAYRGGSCYFRTHRNWSDSPGSLRSATRSGDTPNYRRGGFGFRVARSL